MRSVQLPPIVWRQFVQSLQGSRVGLAVAGRGTMGTKLPRADLHLHRSRDGELFVTSRQDGMIRMLVP